MLAASRREDIKAVNWLCGVYAMKPNQRRIQFSIARLWACATIVAFAAWASTLGQRVSVTTQATGEFNLFPILAAGLLLAVAVGILVQGRSGAALGARAGGAVIVALLIVSSLFVAVRGLVAIFFP
jgi:hypothetical protein